MKKQFDESAENIHSFLSQSGRAFYIPLYQRKYSWDTENCRNLIQDIIFNTKKTIKNKENTVF
ncbi:DUF262 domain-containing protein [Thiomicrospira microaerophila]|uniref:DUF262 domain-containing protein n=1 Tax=Thiomicrospira microaerophila TaxID=406020 RepID=UPI0005C97096|nr:DUF262 domain-containing protein [Thiomicrospira microaerophila]